MFRVEIVSTRKVEVVGSTIHNIAEVPPTRIGTQQTDMVAPLVVIPRVRGRRMHVKTRLKPQIGSRVAVTGLLRETGNHNRGRGIVAVREESNAPA